MDINIIDMDNCISDDRWRKKFIKPLDPLDENPDHEHRLDQYHNLGHLDDHCNAELIQPHFVNFVITTARPEKYRDQTMLWLERKRIPRPLDLLMRGHGDYRSGVDVKRDMITTLRIAGHRIVRAYDDSAKILMMYLHEGIPNVFQLTAKGRLRQITSELSAVGS